MESYYSLIRRADFTDLFKYGQFYLNPLNVFGVVETKRGGKSKDEILNKLFEKSNSFESSFTYLVIQFNSSSFSPEDPLINIEDVSHIYPLDQEAKKELETNFDIHIRIEDPIWSDVYSKIQMHRTKKDCEKGAQNVHKLFSIENNIEYYKKIITPDILEEVVSEVFYNRRPYGKLSIWVYLLRYERHAYYPQKKVGFFMDVVNIVCSYFAQKEVDEDTVLETDIAKFLYKLNCEYSVTDILNKIRESEICSSFLSKLHEIENKIDFLIVSVIFLFLRERYSNGLIYERSFVENITKNEEFKEHFGLISYILGLVLGHSKTYESLYENLPLPIYKNRKEVDSILKKQESDRQMAMEEMRQIEEIKKQKERDFSAKKYGNGSNNASTSRKLETNWHNYGGSSKQSPFPKNTKIHSQETNSSGEVSNELTEPNLPCIMCKYRKGTDELCGRTKPKNVSTREEFNKLKSNGWEIKRQKTQEYGQSSIFTSTQKGN